MQKNKHIDVRTRRYMTQVRALLKMRTELLEKDISNEKLKLAHKALDELSYDDLNSLRNVTNGIVDKILALYNKE